MELVWKEEGKLYIICVLRECEEKFVQKSLSCNILRHASGTDADLFAGILIIYQTPEVH